MSAQARKDHCGERYGRWLLVRYAGRRTGRRGLYECLCDCGKTAIVLLDSLCGGRSRSCGCLRLDRGIQSETKRKAVLEARQIARFGCTLEQRLVAGGYREFNHQRGAAKKRGIRWEFTFWGWRQLWEASGKWPQRGRAWRQFVMARLGDVGPYSPSNVRIIQNSENVSEYYDRERATFGRVRSAAERRAA